VSRVVARPSADRRFAERWIDPFFGVFVDRIGLPNNHPLQTAREAHSLRWVDVIIVSVSRSLRE
jgi:hypothetical protein